MPREKAKAERKAVQLSAEQRALVENATSMARALARRFARRCRIELPELMSIAYEALVHAALRFDPAHGTPFEGFAYARVRGELMNAAILDATRRRRLDLVLRIDASEEPPRADGWEGAFDASPTEGRAHARGWLAGAAASLVTAALVGEPPAAADELLAAREDEARSHAALERALAALEPHEARFVDLYYRRGLTLEEAARQLGVAKRTVQRWHDSAKKALSVVLGAAAS